MKKIGLEEELVLLEVLAEIMGFSAGFLVYSYLMSSTVAKNLFWEIIRRMGITGISIAVDYAVSHIISENIKNASSSKDTTILRVIED